MYITLLLHMVTDDASYLKPVMTPVAWVAGIWLTALDLHLSHRGVRTEHDRKRHRHFTDNLPSSDICLKSELIFISVLRLQHLPTNSSAET